MMIHILVIEHRHGTNSYPCTSPEIAQAFLLDYVRTWWGKECDGAMPEDPQTAILAYFEQVEGESYLVDYGPLLDEFPPSCHAAHRVQKGELV